MSQEVSIKNRYLAQRFAEESNQIEREGTQVTPNQLEATLLAQNGIHSEKELLHIHYLLTSHLSVPWGGRYRDCVVTVGKHVAPEPFLAKELMRNLFLDKNTLSAWELYNKFELIHPFQDYNGRTGRLLWYSVMWENGYRQKYSFLEMYHYQTLDQQRLS